MIDTYNEDDFPEYERPNKSQLKRDAQALLALVKKIMDLSESKWGELLLPDDILGELHQLKEIAQHGARKRQMKRVVKLLRDVDIEVAQEVVNRVSHERVETNASFHKVERWRTRLLTEDERALTDFLRQYVGVDVQYLNQLIRNTKGEVAKGRPPKSSKLLFKLLRDLIDS